MFISEVNMSGMQAVVMDVGGVDAANLAYNWGIEIEVTKRMRLVTTQRE
jgi:hypothetical protein